jgi:ubiquinone/menaquinone biosynthesis C-methylase UbiE/DNA-binding transcriptional ArsR family regulator
MRIVALLENDELSVNELQEITGLGQSRVSTHLSLLTETGLLQARRDGRRTFYRLNPDADGQVREFTLLAMRGARELPAHEADQANLRRVLTRREDQAQAYFSRVAGRFDRSYGPGRSWQALGHLLLRILPPLEVADLGAGEGMLAELLAHRCKRVIAVDNSEKMIAFGARKAKQHHLDNIEFRLGDLEDPPLEPDSLDLVILSQALHHAQNPSRAILAAHRALRSGGELLILDLLQHKFTQAHELYGDRWLGFAESDLQRWLEAARFQDISISRVAREEQEPFFETLLAAGRKP